MSRTFAVKCEKELAPPVVGDVGMLFMPCSLQVHTLRVKPESTCFYRKGTTSKAILRVPLFRCSYASTVVWTYPKGCFSPRVNSLAFFKHSPKASRALEKAQEALKMPIQIKLAITFLLKRHLAYNGNKKDFPISSLPDVGNQHGKLRVKIGNPH